MTNPWGYNPAYIYMSKDIYSHNFFLYMKESNTLVGNATIKQLQRGVLQNTEGHYMEESNSLVGNATIKQLLREVLLNTKGQYMKESNSLAGNANIKQLQR